MRTIRNRIMSFRYAIAGIRKLITQEPNMRIHFLAAIVIIIAGLLKEITNMEWIALAIVIGIVLITEALNTCIEMVCNLVCDNQFHPMVKIIKDISAAAVLFAAIASIVVAALIFIK
jgi:diacylglycerol kinase (ATP)